MRRITRPSPAMIVAIAALVIAIGGTAAALPGRYTVGRDDLKPSSVGARSIGRVKLEQMGGVRSMDPVANDGEFTETEGELTCPPKAPFAFDPSVSNMGPAAMLMSQMAIPNRWGGPLGYHFKILSDLGPEPGFTMKLQCLPIR